MFAVLCTVIVFAMLEQSSAGFCHLVEHLINLHIETGCVISRMGEEVNHNRAMLHVTFQWHATFHVTCHSSVRKFCMKFVIHIQ